MLDKEYLTDQHLVECNNMRSIDIYGANRFEQYNKVREACRGIVVKGDKILLTYEVNTDQWFILGGGVENDETLQ